MKIKKFRKLFSFFSLFALLFNIFFASLTILVDEVLAQQPETVTICHATSADNNPYITENPAKNGDVGGHNIHEGEVWFPGIEVQWGDIIPSFDYGEGQNYPGKNWDETGKAIYDNDCNIPVVPELGSITIIKDEVPGLGTDFNFNLIGPNDSLANFNLNDDGVDNGSDEEVFPNLIEGQYSISETNSPPSHETTIDCTDRNDVESGIGTTINLVGGGDVTCTFINTLKNGTLTVYKITDPADDQSDFPISASGSGTVLGEANRILTTSTPVVYDVIPGIYDVVEDTPEGWSQESNTCEDVEVLPGEGGSCTITNVLMGRIIVKKETNPEQSEDEFVFEASYDEDGFVLSNGESNESEYLLPGVYSVSENVPQGWDLVAVCDDESSPDAIDLSSGETVTCTFENIQKGSIFGYKYEDANGNGVDDGDLVPVLGWEITLWQDLQQLGNPVYTDGSGYYSFTDLLIGFYQVEEEERIGWTNLGDTNVDVVVDPGDETGPVNFVNYKNGSMDGYKFNDIDGDGNWEDEEPAIEGWTFQLQRWNEDEQSWDVVDTDITDSGGNWSFSFGPGKFRVYEVPQVNWIPTTYTSGYYSSAEGLDWTSGARIVGIDFGNFGKGNISGHKWNDSDGDGIWDVGELPLQGWWINAEYPDGSVHHDITDSNGYYYFGDLSPGSYRVYEDSQPGWVQTAPVGDEYVINMTSGAVGLDNPNYDFGNQGNGTITVHKDIDINGDGQVDAHDTSGWTWYINGSGGFSAGTTQSVPAGSYTLTENQIPDYHFSNLTCEAEDYRLDDGIAYVNVYPGEDVECTYTNSRDVGEISGYKFEDYDGDGFWDEEEDGLGGWTIELYEDDDGEIGNFVTDTLTNPGGSYMFEYVLTGTYWVCEVGQDGYQQTYPSGNGCYQVEIEGHGQEVDSRNFGNAPLTDIHGYKWEDLDGNGQRGEEGLLGGWTINLYGLGEGWGLLDSMETESDGEDKDFGWYWFEDLFPGDYKICEELQDNWIQTYPFGEGDGCHYITVPNDNPLGFELVTNALPEPEPVYNFGNQPYNPSIVIEKSNDKESGASAGDTVNYTLVITNDGDQPIYSVEMVDVLPGGFSYIAGTSQIDGSAVGDPTDNAGKLVWTVSIPDPLLAGDSITLTYQALIADNIAEGVHTNLATCEGLAGRVWEEDLFLRRFFEVGGEEIECNIDDSNVPVGRVLDISTSITGQVLGASTELPASGSDTRILFALVGMALAGFGMKKMGKKLERKNG